MSSWETRRAARFARERKELLAVPTVPPTRARRLDPVPGHDLVGSTVTASGEVAAVWALAGDTTSVRGTEGHDRLVVSRDGPHGRQLTSLQDVPVTRPLVDVLPDGQILLVGARCRRTDDVADKNAVVYTASGQLVARGTLGDGIEHVQTTPAGDIWVGYFDEGVFGNLGWEGSRGARPIGARGLVRFTPDLLPAWEFPAGDGLRSICDCYALNVTDQAVLTCYYTDFPVVRIQGDDVRSWTNDVAHSASAVAGSADLVAIAGGFDANRDRLVTGSLGQTTVDPLQTLRMVTPSGEALPAPAKLVSRGATINALAGLDWLQWEISSHGTVLPANRTRP